MEDIPRALTRIEREIILVKAKEKSKEIKPDEGIWDDYGKFILAIRKDANVGEQWNVFILDRIKKGNTMSNIVNTIKAIKLSKKKPKDFFEDPKTKPGPLTKKEKEALNKKKRSFEGKGVDDYIGIKPYEDELVFIPQSGACFYDCLQYITKESYHDRMKKITNYTDGRELEMLEIKDKINILSYQLATGKNKIGCWRTRSKKWNKDAEFTMGFYKFINPRDNKTYAHYIVFKDKNNLPSLDFCKGKVQLYKKKFDPTLFDNQIANWRRIPKPWISKATFYDIEAAPDLLNNRIHMETAIGWTYVDFSKGLEGYDYNYQYEHDINVVKDGIVKYNTYKNVNCTDRYMARIILERDNKQQEWAHNGGMYDTIYFIRKKNMKITGDFTLGSRLAILKIKRNNFTHIFRDTIPFTFCSLRQLCKDYKVKYQKQYYDFEETTYHDILTEKKCNELLEYLKPDVLGYTEGMIKSEMDYNKCGESITVNASAPSIIRRIMQKSCPSQKIYVLMNVRARIKQRKNVKGGFRFPGQKQPLILPLIKSDVWMYGKNYNCLGNWLIGLDDNGLYPDSCRKSSFGVYKGVFINKKEILDKVKIMICDFSYIPIGYGKFVMYVPRNMHKPPLITKHKKIGNYAPTGKIKGYWPICRIMQSISMGCILIDIKWLFVHKKHAMYHTKLYNFICGKKEYYSWTGEKGKRMVWKTLGNSGFGSMLLKMCFPNIYYGNKLYDVMSALELPNGQVRKKVMKHTLTKAPGANGIQLLGVSKNLMDDLSEKLDGINTGKIVYGNTDSLYIGINDLNITKEKLDDFYEKKQKNKEEKLYINVNGYVIIISDITGDVKNDHGSSLIPNYRFIDMNKYTLMFDRLTVSGPSLGSRLTYYDFYWTGVKFSTWEKRTIKYDKDYKELYKKYNKILPLIEVNSWMYGYSDKYVNQKFAKRIFKWYCNLNTNSHLEPKKFNNKIIIEYNEKNVIYFIKRWAYCKDNIGVLEVNIYDYVCLNLWVTYLYIYNEKQKNNNEKNKKIKDILYTKKIFKLYTMKKREKIREEYLLRISKNKYGIIKPWVEKWIRSFAGIRIDGKEIDISTFCKSRVFINDKVSRPLHHASELDKLYKNRKIPKYKGIKIQKPTHKEWCERQYPFNMKSMGKLTLVNKFIRTDYDTLYFVVIGKYETYTLLHNQEIYMLRRHSWMWSMMLMTYLGEGEEKYYKSDKKRDDIPWNNLSLVVCTGNKYNQQHNKHPDYLYFRGLVDNIMKAKIKKTNDIFKHLLDNNF